MLFRGRYFYAQKLGFTLLFNGRHGIMLLSYVLISAFLGRNVNSVNKGGRMWRAEPPRERRR